MRIACIGTGKMGRAVMTAVRDAGHELTAALGAADNPGGAGITRERLGHPDVAIEFTTPQAAVANLLACLRARIPVVTGTTGWHADLAQVRAAVAADGAVFWASNFSPGVAVFTATAARLAALMTRMPGSGVAIHEVHHAAKKDAPSGTALALARAVERASGRIPALSSTRVGSVPGMHTLICDLPFEQVRLVHETRDRRVFADGAVRAAEWLVGRRGLFTMDDMLQLEAP